MADATYIAVIDWIWQWLIDDTINIVLCTSAYTPDTSVSGDEFLSDIPFGARVATQTLTGKTLSAGVFDAADPVFITPPAGQVVTQAIIYRDASPESGARVIRKITDATGLPLTTDGTNITLVLPNDANKIFKTHDA